MIRPFTPESGSPGQTQCSVSWSCSIAGMRLRNKDEKIKMKNTKRRGCAQCTASSFTYTTENCLRQPSLKGETAVGRILLSQGNMGFSSRFFSIPTGYYTQFFAICKRYNWYERYNKLAWWRNVKESEHQKILGNLLGFLWKRRSGILRMFW